MKELTEDFIQELLQNPILADAAALKEVLWLNPSWKPYVNVKDTLEPSLAELKEAGARFQRFAPYLMAAFPETAAGGIIESPLRELPVMREFLNEQQCGINGRLFLKMDSHLPIAGSVKARGGIYEILRHAEELALAAGLLQGEKDYACFAGEAFRQLFSQYTVQVGSTGNLGLSIGIISAKLGFRVIVHMSAEAKAWKKQLLRDKGVAVVEYATDYCQAVAKGREASRSDKNSYFVDDEKSRNLFLGYSVAGTRLKEQLEALQIPVDGAHPLLVYLPCGIGGAPGGITYGLKACFGDAVHCFFVEPTHACSMLLGMATGLHDAICVQDLGLDGKTHADGLAVGRPSAFVGKLMNPLVSGIFTVEDWRLYDFMRQLLVMEGIFIEPSACAAFQGVAAPWLWRQKIDLMENPSATHILWGTGGSLVPASEIAVYQSTYLNPFDI